MGSAPSEEVCDVDGCRGAVVHGVRCIAHLARGERAELLARTGSAIDARGVRVTAALLAELVDCCTDDEGTSFGACDFSHAEFPEEVDLAGVTFAGRAGFANAAFEARARFSGARFEDTADFHAARFGGVAAFGAAEFAAVSFVEARFERDAQFSGARWNGHANLRRASFGGETWFGRGVFSAYARFDDARFGPVSFTDARFERPASFREACFEDDARLLGVMFEEFARFERTRFQRQVHFDGCRFGGEATFAGASVGRAMSMQAVHCERSLSFRQATFEGKLSALATAIDGIDLARVVCKEPVSLSVATAAIDCEGAEFRSGLNLFARWAELRLDDASFSGSSVLSGASKLAGINEEPVVDALRDRTRAIPRRSIPRLVSALRADLSDVTFDDVDLVQTRMSGAKNLDRVRLNGSVVLGRTPRGPRFGRSFPFAWWWSRRQVLGEEAAWRAAGRTPSGWPASSGRSPAHVRATVRRDRGQVRRDAERIAATYRDLRKGREALHNAPGAADLYYGEMEMRRHAAPRLGVERLVLDAYWFVSGYALRAGRSLACLLVTLTVAAVALHQFGFADLGHPFADPTVTTAAATPARGQTPPRTLPRDLSELETAASMPEAWIYASAAAVPGATLPRARLTAAGQAMTVALRVLGPLFIGLALLSVRRRVKRS